jgi:hypothetical protein
MVVVVVVVDGADVVEVELDAGPVVVVVVAMVAGTGRFGSTVGALRTRQVRSAVMVRTP